MALDSTTFPSFDSASIAGVESRSLIMSEPAPLADEISGAKESVLPACIAPKTVLYEESSEKNKWN